jgi:GntR family transcriptional regulator / MocR family aminotransferase
VAPFALDTDDSLPLTRQVTRALRQAVLSGQLKPGMRVPSSRALATELAVSRNTVLDAYAQLLSEGYFDARHGSGTYVAATLPEGNPRAATSASRPAPAARLSKRGVEIAALATSVVDDVGSAFCPGIPALDPELLDPWTRVSIRAHRRTSKEALNYADAAGYRPLREAIAAYLGPARGVMCTADEVLITSGTQQALDIAARLLLDPGQACWFEEPGYLAAGAALVAAGAVPTPVAVDDEGLCVDAGRKRAGRARAAYVSPSHQYPLGVTMTVGRRLRLLEWAERADAWILEDDYDSEFRYERAPLPALRSLDRTGRVMYIGTFSKVLFPALRLGYVIVPPPIVDAFRKQALICGLGAPRLDQVALADFIEQGYFARHIRRMRKIYGERRRAFAERIRERIGGRLELEGATAGLHVSARLPGRECDRVLARRARSRGLCLSPLSAYHAEPTTATGFVMGYGHLDRAQMAAGIEILRDLLDSPGRRLSE